MKKQLTITARRCIIAMLLFPLWGVGGLYATVTVTPISTDYATKKVTFKVAWSGTVVPHNNRVWVWVDFCPVTGAVPATSFSTATVSNPTITDGNGSTVTSTARGFFIQYANANNDGTTVTAILSNAPDAPQKFNWCAYGSDLPPNATVNAGGGYTLRGTLPFTINSSQTVTSKTFGAGTCITSITDPTGRPDGSVDKPNITAVTSPAICYNTAADLTATVSGGLTTAMTYTWNIGGTSSTTPGATKTTSALTATTTYTVQARNAAGCTSTVSNTGTITVHPNFTAGSITTASGNTTVGTNPNITIASSINANGGDGSIFYQWLRGSATLSGSAQTYAIGNNSTNYDTAGTYKINRYAHDGTCNKGWVASTGTYTLTVDSYPPGAGTVTWTCGTQTWSGAVKATPSACSLVGSFNLIANPPAQYRNANNGYGYYYNWTCVSTSPDELCPTPWRMPSLSDLRYFRSQDCSNVATEMGLAGTYQTNNISEVGFAWVLWCASDDEPCTPASTSRSRSLWWNLEPSWGEYCYDKFRGFNVQCVK